MSYVGSGKLAGVAPNRPIIKSETAHMLHSS
jgi:hypothetical protein